MNHDVSCFVPRAYPLVRPAAADAFVVEVSISVQRLALARNLQRGRTCANAMFGSRVLSDPRYEMLLELYIAHYEGRAVSVGDLALAADIPATTGLRKLEKLEEEGFVRRVPDRSDGRRFWVKPADKILGDFDQLLDQLRETLVPR